MELLTLNANLETCLRRSVAERNKNDKYKLVYELSCLPTYLKVS
jgi:hypothetical protein